MGGRPPNQTPRPRQTPSQAEANITQQREPRRNTNIRGTRSAPDASTLTGVERVMDIFLGGCSISATPDDIKEYCSSLGVDVKKVEALATKSEWHKPFKISAVAADREKLLVASFWPKNCFVRKFFRAKSRVVQEQ